MAILIAIDHGNDSIKTEHYRFRSGLTAHKAKPSMMDGLLEYNGVYYTLSRDRLPYMRNKTDDDRFFILSLFAIARELADKEICAPVEIDLAVGLPPEHFGPLKETFEKYFKRGSVGFVYDGKPFCIVIRHVVVCPQAYAAVLAMDQEIAEYPRVFIIDGGGYTIDVGLLREGRPDMKFNRSLEEGTITMYNEIARLVNADHDMLIDEDQILAVLTDCDVRLPEDVIKTIKDLAFEHAKDILNKLRELKVELRSNPCVIMGGAATLFKPVFDDSKMVLAARYELNPNCNVMGYIKMAKNRIRKIEQHHP